ncbi:MAG: efflux RND transporter permease subunit [Dehalococcoidales bacterium]|nr:efflux RND transporter permease subunit [Dehalococcoidales bacterium]
MSWLTKIALKKRWLTFLLIIIVTGVSVWSTFALQMEMIPDIELPMTSIITIYPQAKPETVMNDVTVKIESAVSSIDRLDQLVSTVSEGSTFTFAVFEYGTDMQEVNDTIRQNLDNLSLPTEVRNLSATMPQVGDNPRLFEIDINVMPIVMVSMTGDVTPAQLEEIANSSILPQLQEIDGVYHVGVSGGSDKQVLVNMDVNSINAANISMSQVAAVLGTSEYNSLNSLENTPVSPGISLSDIADVKLGLPSGTSVSRTNGQTSISITVTKEPEANTVTVANAVMDTLEEIGKTLKQDGISLVTVMDQSDYIETSIGDLVRNAIIGFVLAVIVVFFFLMEFRASMVTAISIPLSLFIGFLVMRFLGITINILTLSAMAIAVGRVIDNSIVVLEVIYRRIQQGEEFRSAALNGVREVATPITSSTIATVVIFIPIAFIGGIVGEMFMPFALTMTAALIASLLVALIVIPPMSNFKVKKEAKDEGKNTWYQRLYLPVLKWSLSHRAATIIVSLVLFFGSFSLVPLIGTAFMPEMGNKMVSVEIEMPKGTTLEETEEAAILIEDAIKGNPKVSVFQTSAGSSNSIIGSFSSMIGGGSTASISVYLTEGADQVIEANKLRNELEGILDNATVSVSSGNSMASAMMGGGLDIAIRGDNYQDIAGTSRELMGKLEGMEGIAELDLALSTTEPKLSIIPDMGKIMSAGLSMDSIQKMQGEFTMMSMGSTVSKVTENGHSYDVFLNAIVPNLSSVEQAEGLFVGYPDSVPLGKIATVTIGQQQTSIQRIDEKLSASITGVITDENIGRVNLAVQREINSMDLPEGVEISMGGVSEMMTESFSGMGIAILIAIGLAFAVIAVTFRSLLKPVIIMASLPLASIGAMVGLLIAGQTLGISALMGILMLVGIVLTNAIVLLDLVDKLRKEGMSTYNALIESGRTRMRPILMTALTTMIAMLPIAIGLGEGTVLSAELAVVVIGGLFSSTLLTLLVIPVLYSLIDRKKKTES